VFPAQREKINTCSLTAARLKIEDSTSRCLKVITLP